jgi:hypothetical protein
MHTMLETKKRPESEPTPVTTTLYDLIEAMQDEASSEADDFVVTAVMELLRTGRIAFLQRQYLQPFRPTLEGVSHS